MATRKVITKKHQARLRRHGRVRARMHGTAECPRLVVFRGVRRFDGQLIDDDKHVTLLGFSDRPLKLKGSKTECAKALGMAAGKQISQAGYKCIVFDRGGFRYQGRVAAFADGVRSAGIKF